TYSTTSASARIGHDHVETAVPLVRFEDRPSDLVEIAHICWMDGDQAPIGAQLGGQGLEEIVAASGDGDGITAPDEPPCHFGTEARGSTRDEVRGHGSDGYPGGSAPP